MPCANNGAAGLRSMGSTAPDEAAAAHAAASVSPSAPAPPPLFEPGDVLAWGVPRLRDLPWRQVRDPWLILLAEVMLQQTQADRVIPKWTEFCDQYPTPAVMAASSLGDVLRGWQGLGYPRRARNLHAAAGEVVARHGGRLPADLDALLALPGVGPYTARAVLAFAFEQDAAVVDTNIARILARTSGRRLTPKAAQAAADALVPAGDGWIWNQVLMDLGAVLCRPQPKCESCPLATQCRWHAAGRPRPDPADGSAGVSGKQAPFEGSDRQRRGAVLRALAAGERAAAEFDIDILAGLVADRLVVVVDGIARLP